uniref:Uncharacterized protein n=1 Tax=Amphimedon queenslandica TaxID=400682 RepID=A0A1X7T5F2_AMPQE
MSYIVWSFIISYSCSVDMMNGLDTSTLVTVVTSTNKPNDPLYAKLKDANEPSVHTFNNSYSKILKVNGVGNTSSFSSIDCSTSSCPHCLCGISHCSNKYNYVLNEHQDYQALFERCVKFLLKVEVCSVGQQCSAASTWRCLGSLVVTTASDAKSTTYKKNITRLY